jgi:hypothetical protein
MDTSNPQDGVGILNKVSLPIMSDALPSSP